MQWHHINGSEKKHRLKIGNTSIQCTTFVQWSEEMESVEGSVDFGDREQEQAYYARFESGELANICIRVYAIWQDAEESDLLGGCHVEAKDLNTAALEMAEENGMRLEACKRLQDLVIRRAKLYKFKGI